MSGKLRGTLSLTVRTEQEKTEFRVQKVKRENEKKKRHT